MCWTVSSKFNYKLDKIDYSMVIVLMIKIPLVTQFQMKACLFILTIGDIKMIVR